MKVKQKQIKTDRASIKPVWIRKRLNLKLKSNSVSSWMPKSSKFFIKQKLLLAAASENYVLYLYCFIFPQNKLLFHEVSRPAVRTFLGEFTATIFTHIESEHVAENIEFIVFSFRPQMCNV